MYEIRREAGFLMFEVRVRVNRAQTCAQVVKSMDWNKDNLVLGALNKVPKCSRTGIEDVLLVFFNNGEVIRKEQVREIREDLRLPPDIQAQAQANKDDVFLSKVHPNGYGYRDQNGLSYRLTFYHSNFSGGRPAIFARRSDAAEWPSQYWLAGRKEP